MIVSPVSCTVRHTAETAGDTEECVFMANLPGQNVNEDVNAAPTGPPGQSPPLATPDAGQVTVTPVPPAQQHDQAYVERLQQQLAGRTQQAESLTQQVKDLEDKGKPWKGLMDSGTDPALLERMAAAAQPPQKPPAEGEEVELDTAELRRAGFVHKDDLDKRDQRRQQEESLVQAYERENQAIDAAATGMGFDTKSEDWDMARHAILVRLDRGVIDPDGNVVIPPALDENNNRLLADPKQIKAAVDGFCQSVANLHTGRVKHLGTVPDAPPGGTGSGAGITPPAGGEAVSLVAIEDDKDRLAKAQQFHDKQLARQAASASSEM